MISKPRLKQDDWDALAEFEGTFPHKALKKLVDILVHNTQVKALSAAQTMEQVAELRGYGAGLLHLLNEIKNARKKVEDIKKKQEKLKKKE